MIAERDAVDGGGAAGGRVQTQDHPQRGRLARAVGSHESGDLSWPYGEGQLVDGNLTAVTFGEFVDFDHCANGAGAATRRHQAVVSIRSRRLPTGVVHPWSDARPRSH